MELASRPGKMPSWHSPSDNTRTDRWCTSRSFAPTLQASMHCLHSQHNPCEPPLHQLGHALARLLTLHPLQESHTRQFTLACALLCTLSAHAYWATYSICIGHCTGLLAMR